MKTFFIFLILGTICLFPTVASLSNESLAAQNNLSISEDCLESLVVNDISTTRANESFNQAKQLYNAQIALEARGGKANYLLVLQYAKEVCSIKDLALEAKDELTIFQNEYSEAASRINISAMDATYNNLLLAYNEERFEDVLEMIDLAYAKLSETEASQTQIELFYRSTKASISNFFSENWKTILIITAAILLIFIFFWKSIQKIIIRKKLANLRIRKDSLNNLLRKAQNDYFKTKKMSEMEFAVKMKTFHELIRDIDRQLPVYHEQLAKVDKPEKVYK